MRMLKSTAWFAVACLALLATASAQQLVSPSTANYELTTRAASEEPRPFSTRAANEARPLPSAYQTAQQAKSPRPRWPQAPVNFRLASAEEPIARQSDQQGRA